MNTIKSEHGNHKQVVNHIMCDMCTESVVKKAETLMGNEMGIMNQQSN